MPTYVKNYIFIKYEDLNKNYDNMLSKIQTIFNLKRKQNNSSHFNKIIKYKGVLHANDYHEKTIQFNKKYIDIIKKNLDKEQENKLGYLL